MLVFSFFGADVIYFKHMVIFTHYLKSSWIFEGCFKSIEKSLWLNKKMMTHAKQKGFISIYFLVGLFFRWEYESCATWHLSHIGSWKSQRESWLIRVLFLAIESMRQKIMSGGNRYKAITGWRRPQGGVNDQWSIDEAAVASGIKLKSIDHVMSKSNSLSSRTVYSRDSLVDV